MAAPLLPDRRRVAGPLETFVPERRALVSHEVIKGGKRTDGRGIDTIRPIFAAPNVVEQARGSFYLEVGSTKVMCAVYGPRPPHRPRDFSERGILECAVTWAPFAAGQRKLGFLDSDEQALAATIEQALVDAVRLDTFPKLAVDVFVTVLEDGGSVDAVAVTCAGAALAHAGIALLDTVVASSANIVEGQILMDCTCAEERVSSGSVLIALMPSLNETTFLSSRGEIEWNTLGEALEMSMDACVRIRAIVDQALKGT